MPRGPRHRPSRPAGVASEHHLGLLVIRPGVAPCEYFGIPPTTQILVVGLSSAHDIVVHGFTHREEMKARGKTVIVNPGEACGWLHGAPTAAILDLDTRQVEIIKLTDANWSGR